MFDEKEYKKIVQLSVVEFDILKTTIQELEDIFRQLKPPHSVIIVNSDFMEVVGFLKIHGKWRIGYSKVDDDSNLRVTEEMLKPLDEQPIKVRVRACYYMASLRDKIIEAKNKYMKEIRHSHETLRQIIDDTKNMLLGVNK